MDSTVYNQEETLSDFGRSKSGISMRKDKPVAVGSITVMQNDLEEKLYCLIATVTEINCILDKIIVREERVSTDKPASVEKCETIVDRLKNQVELSEVLTEKVQEVYRRLCSVI